MDTSRTCLIWLTLILVCARHGGTADDVTDPMTSQPSEDEALHVHLHNASHGALLAGDERHEVHARILAHNETHSVLHLNSSGADMHRDLLVSHDVLNDMALGAAPENSSDTGHATWSGHEELVPTSGGWMTSPLNGTAVSAEDRQAEMAAADSAHQATVRLVVAGLGAAVAVTLLAGVAVGVLRSRRHGDAALLADEDEEFTVFSVVDHPYPGKKGDSYAPLN